MHAGIIPNALSQFKLWVDAKNSTRCISRRSLNNSPAFSPVRTNTKLPKCLIEAPVQFYRPDLPSRSLPIGHNRSRYPIKATS